MNQKNQCPQCQNEIARERMADKLVICNHCGWTKNSIEEQMNYDNSLRVIRVTVALSALFIVGFIQAVNWDQHFFSVIPLKAKSALGVATADDLRSLAKMCRERGKPQCIEKAYAQISEKEPNNLMALANYGKMLAHNKKYEQSIEIFSQYFQRGGISLETAYDYAKVLRITGDIDEASRYFQFVLKAKPDMLQFTVTQSYVDLLVETNQLKEAKRLIKNIRRKGTNTSYFMESKLQEIDRLIADNRTSI